jgi:hypothetical protein
MHEALADLAGPDGVFLRRDAIAAGYDDRALRRSVRAGVLRRISTGAYVAADRWDGRSPEERHLLLARAALRATKTDLVLSHTTAAVVHGAPIWDLPLDVVHVTRRDGRLGRREAGIVQHAGHLGPGDSLELDGVAVTRPARTALDLTTLTDVMHALPVLDDFLGRDLTTRQELMSTAETMRHWPGMLSSQVAVRLADGRAESPGESLARYRFRQLGLPAPELQYEVRDQAGRLLGRVDFAWPALGIFIEFDGRAKYDGLRRLHESAVDVVLREKRREEAICEATGWICLRIVWADLFHPERILERFRRAVERRAA